MLSDTEIRILERLVDGIIPSEDGFGALSADVVTFIIKLLNSSEFESTSTWKKEYKKGLKKIIKYEKQYAEIENQSNNKLITKTILSKGFSNSFNNWPNSSDFFHLIRTHTIYGFLSDPKYGGNKNKIGWRFYNNKFFK